MSAILARPTLALKRLEATCVAAEGAPLHDNLSDDASWSSGTALSASSSIRQWGTKVITGSWIKWYRAGCTAHTNAVIPFQAEAMERYNYRIAGLRVTSAIELPGMVLAPEPGHEDVTIRFAGLNASGVLEGESRTGWRADAQGYVLCVRGVAAYRVTRGDLIEVDPVSGAELSDLTLFLLGSAFGALLQQRGMLALHASAVDVAGRAMAFAGPAQTGKSTLAAFLTRRGYPLVTDDVAVVIRSGTGGSAIWPGPGRIKLWRDGIELLGGDPRRLARVGGSRDKYHFPVGTVDAQGETAPVPLARLYVVTTGEVLSIERLEGLEAIEAVWSQTYRVQFVVPMGLAEQHFRSCVEAARSVEVWRLVRPRGFKHMEEVLDAIEKDCAALDLPGVPVQNRAEKG